jgi:hypothetical protein
VKLEQLISSTGKEDDEESVGCATEAEPEGDAATEVDAATECGDNDGPGTLTMSSDRESVAAQAMKVAAVEDEKKSSSAVSGLVSTRPTELVGDGSANPRRQRRRASKTSARNWRPTLSLESASVRGQDDGSTFRLPTPPGRQPPGLLPPRPATTRKRTKAKRSDGKKDDVDSEKPKLDGTARADFTQVLESSAPRGGQDGANTHAKPSNPAGAMSGRQGDQLARGGSCAEPTASWTYAYLFGDAEEPSPYVRS